MFVMTEKLNALTSLRFFAALLVVLYHTVPPTVFADWPALANILGSGFTGVPLFFCLSGFILFIVYDNLTSTRHLLLRFFLARVARIYPLYVFSLLLDIPRLLAARAAEYGLELGILATGATLSAQMLMLQVWVPQLGGLNYPSWSVATEAAFYLWFPIAVVFVRRLKTPRTILLTLCAACAVAVLLATLAPVLAAATDPAQMEILLNRNPIAKFPDFLAGMLLGALWTHWRDAADRIPFAPTALAVVGAVSWLGIMAAGAGSLGGGTMMAAILLPAFCLLIFGLASRGRRALSGRPFVFLGEISYAVYLLHAPIYHLFFDWMQIAFGAQAYVLYLLAVLAASAGAYLAIEVPMRRWINLLPQRWRRRGNV